MLKESNLNNIHDIFPFEKTSTFYLLHQSYSLNTVLFLTKQRKWFIVPSWYTKLTLVYEQLWTW